MRGRLLVVALTLGVSMSASCVNRDFESPDEYWAHYHSEQGQWERAMQRDWTFLEAITSKERHSFSAWHLQHNIKLVLDGKYRVEVFLTVLGLAYPKLSLPDHQMASEVMPRIFETAEERMQMERFQKDFDRAMDRGGQLTDDPREMDRYRDPDLHIGDGGGGMYAGGDDGIGDGMDVASLREVASEVAEF